MPRVSIILLVLAVIYGIEGVAIPDNANFLPSNFNNFQAWQMLQNIPSFESIRQQIEQGGNTNGAAITTFIDSNGKKTNHVVYSDNGKVSTFDFR